jgi:hypothetical protein
MLQARINGTRQLARVFCGARRQGDVMSPLGAVGGARAAFPTIGRAAMVQAYEVALMASVAAMLPRHLLGDRVGPARGTLPPAQAHTALTAHPVLLVHGFGGTKSRWSLVAQTLSARGLIVDAITYTPFGTSVEQLRRPARRRGGQDVVSNRRGQGASGRTQPGRGGRRPSHCGRSPHRAGRYGRHPGVTIRGFAVGETCCR